MRIAHDISVRYWCEVYAGIDPDLLGRFAVFGFAIGGDREAIDGSGSGDGAGAGYVGGEGGLGLAQGIGKSAIGIQGTRAVGDSEGDIGAGKRRPGYAVISLDGGSEDVVVAHDVGV
jgi:hypothetical protein